MEDEIGGVLPDQWGTDLYMSGTAAHPLFPRGYLTKQLHISQLPGRL